MVLFLIASVCGCGCFFFNAMTLDPVEISSGHFYWRKTRSKPQTSSEMAASVTRCARLMIQRRWCSGCFWLRVLQYCDACSFVKQELSYRKQIARQLRTQYVEGIYRPNYPVTMKSRLRVTQGHCKRNHWTYRTRLSSSRVIWRWILSWPWYVG